MNLTHDYTLAVNHADGSTDVETPTGEYVGTLHESPTGSGRWYYTDADGWGSDWYDRDVDALRALLTSVDQSQPE